MRSVIPSTRLQAFDIPVEDVHRLRPRLPAIGRQERCYLRSLISPYHRLHHSVCPELVHPSKAADADIVPQPRQCVQQPQPHDMGPSRLHVPAQFKIRRLLMAFLHSRLFAFCLFPPHYFAHIVIAPMYIALTRSRLMVMTS